MSAQSGLDQELRLALIGQTGAGKSATGNTLLGVKRFNELGPEKSANSKCKLGIGERCGLNLVVVDTPGLFDTRLSNDKVSREVIKCVGITSPGPHAIVLVCKIGRFVEEDQKTVQYFIDKFGESVLKYMIVLFTCKDELTNRKQTVDEFIKCAPKNLANLLEMCGNRYITFNNRATGVESQKQVNELIEKVRAMVATNGGSSYTNEIYREAENQIQHNIKEHRKNLEDEKEQEKMEMEEKLKQQFEKKFKVNTIGKRELETKMKQERVKLERTLREEFESLMSDESLRRKEREDIESGSGFWGYLETAAKDILHVFLPTALTRLLDN